MGVNAEHFLKYHHGPDLKIYSEKQFEFGDFTILNNSINYCLPLHQ